MEKPNRADRRKNKFGGGRATEHGGWPTVQPNPAFQVETPAAPAEQPAAAKPAAAKPAAAKPDGANEPVPKERG